MSTKELEKIEKIEDYASAVSYYAEKGINNLFFNDGNDHALIFFRNIFKYAKNKIRIVAKNLNNEVTNNSQYINTLESFLRKENRYLEIILTDYDPDTYHRLFKNLSLYKNQITIKSTKGKKLNINLGDYKREINFCVADDKIYRFENDILNRKAICNFNDTQKSKSLIDLFYSVFNDPNLETITI